MSLLKLIVEAIIVPVTLVTGLVIFYIVFKTMGISVEPVFYFILIASPIWIPVTIYYLAFNTWMGYVKLRFEINNGRTTLRIHLPQVVLKSPEAMESIFSQIYSPNGPDNLMQEYLDGKHPLVSSFELVSIGGEVRFYMNVPTRKIKNIVEAQFYAQYPGIEILEEVFDYTDEITFDPERYEMMAFHLGKREDSEFTIKTYIDFGLDKMPKEELKFEPMAPMIEQLGKIGSLERAWIQILVVPHTDSSWKDRVRAAIDKIMKKDSKAVEKDEETGQKQVALTQGEKDTINSMERNAGKYAFDTAIRFLYIAEKEKFNGDSIGSIIRTFSQYDLLGRNSIGVRWRSDFDYNFISDRSGKKREKMKKDELLGYKLREYSTMDRRKKTDAMKVFSTEELATFFHIPGESVVTPSLPRITTTRKGAPSNLPTGLPSL